jgi:hypothetical protein
MMESRLAENYDSDSRTKCASSHLSNRVYSSDLKLSKTDRDRVISLRGMMICHCCYISWSGISLRSFQRILACLRLGNAPADMRKVTSATPQHVTDKVMVNLLAMVDAGYGQTLPTSEGGQNRQFIQFPFRRQRHLASELAYFMARQTSDPSEQARIDSSLEKKSSLPSVAATTLQRAMRQLKEQHQIYISVAKTKNFMQCDACSKFETQSHKCKSLSDRIMVHKARSEHLSQVTTERKNFEMLRDQAK